MNFRLFSLMALIGSALALGCHGQVPAASSKVVNLTWSASTSCVAGQPACNYAVYRAAASSGTCPVTTSTAWSEVTTSTTRPSGLAYTDPTAQGLTVCYNVETVQGSANSGPSNTVGPFQVPGTPTAPGLNQPTVAQNAAPNQALPAAKPALDAMNYVRTPYLTPKPAFELQAVVSR